MASTNKGFRYWRKRVHSAWL